jgi:mevalonate kinase
MTTATAPGKTILVGEHAVVYGRPAIAAPVCDLAATARITPLPAGSGCVLVARDIQRTMRLREASEDEPLALAARLALAALQHPSDPDWCIDLSSTIPIAGGLGSGAALSTALVRAIFTHAGHTALPAQVSEIVFESERFYHGVPSGIDNTVIAYGLPIWFVKGRPPQPFSPGAVFTLLIADSGIAAPTKETVADVRRGWQSTPHLFEARFDAIAVLVKAARKALEQGQIRQLGAVFDENQTLLAQLGVSAAPLERLLAAARDAGALGAKLSGGGRGGNIIALVEPAHIGPVQQALYTAGAARVIVTTLQP